MYILKNSIKNLFRNKVRSIFYIIVVLLMIYSIAVSIIINSSTSIVVSRYKQKFESDVQIKINQEKLVEGALSGLSIRDYEPTTKDYFDFADSKYVKEAIFTGRMRGYIEGLREDKHETSSNGIYEAESKTNGNIIGYSPRSNQYKLNGINIKEGRLFKDNNECIVTEDFLNYNYLNLGDEINILNEAKGNKNLKLKIVGVYEDKTTVNSDVFDTSYENSKTILTTYQTLAEFENISRFDEPTIYTNAQFILRNSKSREKFESELRSKGLKDIYKVTINESEYNKVVSPVEQLKTISFVSMYVILITGTILLTMISILSLKDIKYEIGVLRAIGISKFKVAQGYLYEGCIITTICLILGMGIAAVSAQPISNEIFKNQIEITQKTEEQPIVEDMSPGNFRNVDNENSQKEIKSIRLILTQESIFKTIVISIFLSLIISMVAIYNAIIYKPIQILFDRN